MAWLVGRVQQLDLLYIKNKLGAGNRIPLSCVEGTVSAAATMLKYLVSFTYNKVVEKIRKYGISAGLDADCRIGNCVVYQWV